MKKMFLIGLVLIVSFSYVFASGTKAGEAIVASSTNLTVEYTNGIGGTEIKSASEFNLKDATANVLEINGLVETMLNLTGLSGLNFSENIYKNVVPGNDYILRFSYLNRSNNDEIVSFSSTVTDTDWSGTREITSNMLEDSTFEFIVTINAGEGLVENLERATLNVLTRLVDPDNVVSYNSFASAIGYYDGGYLSNVQYGGEDNISHNYTFEVEGYILNFVNIPTNVRAVIQSPPTYKDGNQSDVVPGAKICYTVVVKNTSKAIAKDVILNDKIPNNCHFYNSGGNAPTFEGAGDYEWITPLNNSAGENSAVQARVTIPAEGTVTISYCVTID